MLGESGSVPMAGPGMKSSPTCPASSPSLTLLSISARSLSRSFCQSCSCPLILATSSCIMWFSCSVVASNWIRLTLDARALLSAFCKIDQHGLGRFLQRPVSVLPAALASPAFPTSTPPPPFPNAGWGGARGSPHQSPSLGVLCRLSPSPAFLSPDTAPGGPQDREREELAGLSVRGRCYTLGAPRLLTSMSFCFCRWSSMRLLVVMLSFSQSPWTCRIALCTWPSSSSSYSSDRGAFGAAGATHKAVP